MHTKIGNTAIGAKINHKIMPLTTQLNTGDQVEIITSDSSKPKAEWLEFVLTSKAKQAIKSYLKREQEHNIQRGMKILDERLAELNINPNGRVIRKLIAAYDSSNKEELYTKIGAGIVSLDNLEKVVKSNSKNKLLKFWTLFIKSNDDDADDDADTTQEQKESDKQDNNQESPTFVIADC